VKRSKPNMPTLRYVERLQAGADGVPAEKRSGWVRYEFDGIVEEGPAETFAETALLDAWNYDDQTRLSAAIRLGMPEILERGSSKCRLSKEDRRAILEGVLMGEHRKRGKSLETAKAGRERDRKIWNFLVYLAHKKHKIQSEKPGNVADKVAAIFTAPGSHVSRKTVLSSVWESSGGYAVARRRIISDWWFHQEIAKPVAAKLPQGKKELREWLLSLAFTPPLLGEPRPRGNAPKQMPHLSGGKSK